MTGTLEDEGCISSEAGVCETTVAPGMANAEGVAVSPDGKSVYITSDSEGSIIHFKRNTGTGALTYEDCVTSRSSGCESGDNVPGLSGAWGIAVSPEWRSSTSPPTPVTRSSASIATKAPGRSATKAAWPPITSAAVPEMKSRPASKERRM